MRGLTAALALALALAATPALAQPALELDHAWIAVSPGAPERAALERAGFRIAPTVNHHEGQGTSSVTIEFENGFLELLWPDDSVPVAPGMEAGKARFVAKSAWRTSGSSPFSVGMHRTPAAPAALPFETWKITADWMEKGASMEMLYPRGFPGLTLFIPGNRVDAAANRALIASGRPEAAMFRHPNGVRRLTSVKITAPSAAGLPPSAEWVRANAAGVELAVGREWLMEATLDDGAQKRTADLRPDLPLVVHY